MEDEKGAKMRVILDGKAAMARRSFQDIGK